MVPSWADNRTRQIEEKPGMKSWRTGRWGLCLAYALVILGTVSCAQDPEAKKQTYLERGRAYHTNGKYNEAIIELKNALQIDPKFTPALYHLGLSYKGKGWLMDAARELQKVTTLTPDWPDGRAALGSVYVELEAWDDVLAEANSIRKADPGNVEGIYLTSLALKGKKRLGEALDLVKTAIQRDQNLAELYKTQGDILAELGKDADAEQSYQAALARNQNYTDAHVGLGELLAARKDRAGAESAFLRAKALDPASLRPRLALARFYSGERRYAQGIAELEAIPKPTRSPQVEMTLGELYIRANRSDDAVQILSPLIQRAPQSAPLRFLLGHAYLGTNNVPLAMHQFEEALRLSPSNPFARYGLGVAYLRYGKPKEALKAFEEVGKELAGSTEYLINVGIAKLQLGRPNESIAAVNLAMKNMQDDIRLY